MTITVNIQETSIRPPQGFKSVYDSEDKARSSLISMFKNYKIQPLRQFNLEENEMSMCSQILECWKSTYNGTAFKYYLMKYLVQ